MKGDEGAVEGLDSSNDAAATRNTDTEKRCRERGGSFHALVYLRTLIPKVGYWRNRSTEFGERMIPLVIGEADAFFEFAGLRSGL